jgi:hypothetical protein
MILLLFDGARHRAKGETTFLTLGLKPYASRLLMLENVHTLDDHCYFKMEKD